MQSPRVYRAAPDDDINQILRVVKESPDEHVVLVLPPGCHVLRHDVNLRLLVSYAQQARAQVAVVTEDPVTKDRVAHYGIPIYDTPDGPGSTEGRTIGAAEPSDTRDGDRHGGTWTLWSRRLAVIAIIIAALVVLRYALVPKVHITLTASSEHIRYTIDVPILPERLGALHVESIEVIASASVTPTGLKRVGVTAAEGVVVFINSGEEPAHISKGTVVATQTGEEFQVMSDVQVPGRSAQFFLDVPVGVQSGRAEARAIALHPGADGNVGPDRIRIIRGEWPHVTVRNVDPFLGGTDAMVPAVTEADLVRVRDEVLLEFDRILATRLDQLKQQYDRLSLVAVEAPEPQVINGGSGVGEVAEVVTAQVRSVAHSYWVDPTDFVEIIEEGIPERVPIGYTWERTMGFELYAEGYDSSQGELTLTVLVPVRQSIDGPQLAQAIAGMPVDEALAALEQQPGIASAQVLSGDTERLPSWAPWIRIEVISAAARP